MPESYEGLNTERFSSILKYPMKKALPTRVSIFLSVDGDSVCKYYNSHDPAPLYNRQLSHEFQEYLLNSITTANEISTIRYKFICTKESDQKFAEPILMSIRRHFEIKRTVKEKDFTAFKKENYALSIIFLTITGLQSALLAISDGDYQMLSFFSNALYVFGCVILWKSIERLLLYWNRFRKEILVLKKMETAGSIIIVNEKEFSLHCKYDDAA